MTQKQASSSPSCGPASEAAAYLPDESEQDRPQDTGRNSVAWGWFFNHRNILVPLTGEVFSRSLAQKSPRQATQIVAEEHPEEASLEGSVFLKR